MKTYIATLVTIIAALVQVTSRANTSIIQHLGSGDPRDEGFTLDAPGNAQLGPVTGDMGFDAWSIDVNSGSEFGFYTYFLSSQEQQSVSSLGWLLSVRLRMVEVPDSGGAMLARFYTGSTLFSLYFGAEADGDAFVQTAPSGAGGSLYVLDGTGGGYHQYDLHYDPVASSAVLSVDGVDRITGLVGVPLNSSPRVDFGGGQGVTHANWNQFALETIPEPNAGALLIVGAAAMAYRRFSCK